MEIRTLMGTFYRRSWIAALIWSLVVARCVVLLCWIMLIDCYRPLECHCARTDLTVPAPGSLRLTKIQNGLSAKSK